MRTLYIRPCHALQPHIHTFAVISTGENENGLLIDQHPTGYTALAWILSKTSAITDLARKKQFKPTFFFTGQLKRYTPLQSGSWSAVYAVFKPLGAARFFPLPLHHLTDQFTELSDILPDQNIYQRLSDCSNDPQLVVTVMEQWLLGLFTARKNNMSEKQTNAFTRLSGIVKKMTQVKGRNYIEDVCQDFTIPQRTLEAQFKNMIGISPKSFSRMLRINHAHHQCILQKKSDWHEVVHECNFFDQAHFIKEFKTCFGFTPSGIPAGQWNLSEQLVGYTQKKTIHTKHRLFADAGLCNTDKKNGPVAFTTDPDIYFERGYLATFA